MKKKLDEGYKGFVEMIKGGKWFLVSNDTIDSRIEHLKEQIKSLRESKKEKNTHQVLMVSQDGTNMSMAGDKFLNEQFQIISERTKK